MSKLRSVSTQFWSDPWVEELSSSEKLLYLYLITNEKTNMLGVYEVSFRKMSFETGIPKDTIERSIKLFEKQGKVRYINNYVILLNFAKHQNYNTNMKKSAIDVFNSLHESIKQTDEIIDKDNPSEGFERVLNCLGMVRKVEVELEDEFESEDEKEDSAKNKFLPPTFEDFLRYAIEKKPLVDPIKLRLKYDSWAVANWYDGKGKKIKNWQQKLLNTLPYIDEKPKVYKVI